MIPTLEEQLGEILLRYMFGTAPSEYGIKELAALVRAREQKAFDTGVWSGKELQKKNDEF